MNALSEAVIAQLTDAFRCAVEDTAVRGIVIAGSGKAFIAGADVGFFVRSIDQRDFDRIVRFTRSAQDLLQNISASEAGRGAGSWDGARGGLELALACHAIVATPKASMSLGDRHRYLSYLGGTQRTTRRVGKAKAGPDRRRSTRWTRSRRLVDGVVPHEELDAEVAARLRGAAIGRCAVEGACAYAQSLSGLRSRGSVVPRFRSSVVLRIHWLRRPETRPPRKRRSRCE